MAKMATATTATPTTSEFVRVSEVSQALGIGTRQVYNLLAANVIPNVRIGPNGRIVIPREAWERWRADLVERALAASRQQKRAA